MIVYFVKLDRKDPFKDQGCFRKEKLNLLYPGAKIYEIKIGAFKGKLHNSDWFS